MTTTALSPLMARACQRHLELVAEQRRYSIEWVKSESYASANVPARAVKIPRPSTYENYAVACHELGHLIAGDCPKRPPHLQGVSDSGQTICVACEVDAWRAGMQLAACWNDAMHTRMARALGTYRIRPARQIEAIDRLVGTVALREEQQRRRETA